MLRIRAKAGRPFASAHRETANDRFKETFGAWLWGGIMAATVFHFGLFAFFPELKASDVSYGVSEFEAIELPPEIEVPPPPEAIRRPALPVVSQTELQEDVTIAPTTFEENPVDNLPPPPSAASRLSDQPVFTPFTVAPRVRDPAEAAKIVESKYPSVMKNAGIGGTVLVWAFIDANGVVKNTQVKESSGMSRLDDAAEAAVREFEFVPALNYDRRVPVWISIPITFEVKH